MRRPRAAEIQDELRRAVGLEELPDELGPDERREALSTGLGVRSSAVADAYTVEELESHVARADELLADAQVRRDEKGPFLCAVLHSLATRALEERKAASGS